eukprot:TRINITY_DN9423_c0_g1_i1.p1 TRINITY_DN9423_c0_g1~~TRINITY_DN9423_c0_g1_i1.p1  ORF type:complete len:69 (+),score=18.42 TRINITY_DN9423_c0_g1_i1:259-465(+)
MYKQLGDWIRACYGAPVVLTSDLSNGIALLQLPTGVIVDRVWVRENIVYGERTRAYQKEKVPTAWPLV